jgi:hypothetical protein
MATSWAGLNALMRRGRKAFRKKRPPSPGTLIDASLSQVSCDTTVRAGYDFIYAPLRDSSRQIRLLRLSPASNTSEVALQMITVFTYNPPAYAAVSYTWGAPGRTWKISVNGEPIMIREHCYFALQQLKDLNYEGWFWIDALSIARHSVEEKSRQVGIMAQIFGGSKKGFISLGPVVTSMLSMPENFAFLEAVHIIEEAPLQRVQGSRIERAHALSLSQVLEIAKLEWKRHGPPMYETMRVLEDAAYWTRIWIIQEIFMARNVALLHRTRPLKLDDIAILKSKLPPRIWVFDLKQNTWAFSASNELRDSSPMNQLLQTYRTLSDGRPHPYFREGDAAIWHLLLH